jgi:MraZ protein
VNRGNLVDTREAGMPTRPQYIGIQEISLDDKGRIVFGQYFRSLVDAHEHDTWWLTRGFDGQILLFTSESWNTVVERLHARDMFNPEVMDFARLLFGSAHRCKLDNAYRLVIPAPLRDFAKITLRGKAVLVGAGDHLELWEAEAWRKHEEDLLSKYRLMASRFLTTTNEPQT